MKKRVLLLGCTGSIGQNTLEVLAGLGHRCEVVGLAAGSRWQRLAQQARYWNPQAVAISDVQAADPLRSAVGGGVRVLAGPDAPVELVDSVACDCVVSAVVGAAGLPATLRAVELGRQVALANKETLVIAGGLIAPLARRTGASLIPIDSEHSAVFQALQAGKRAEVKRIYLTASGGPFRTWAAERIAAATLEDALNHPTWDMGPKVTIDSATMMNKALEIIEARWLFDLPPERIDVLVHPESVVHSLVEFCDGSMIAQLGSPDMRTPIQYALTYPDRLPCPSEPLDLSAHRRLHFEPPDPEKFPALRLGHETARRGGTAGAVLNAANESAVELFRAGEIRFPEIVQVTEQALGRHSFLADPSLQDLLAADRWARNEVVGCTTC
ncbi:MAG: 1-deoxy-D-xylulose-5-phosphate reductoisomerase [Phycisphaerales bacterium]|nr:MAG: 1-deoxy-D-xylulose-5-phosphate reductoisomerase [Phycisphaerales bacterium]